MSGDSNAASRREVPRRGAAATDALFVGTATAGVGRRRDGSRRAGEPIVDEGETTKKRPNRIG